MAAKTRKSTSTKTTPDDRRFGVTLLGTLGAVIGLAAVGLGGLLLRRRPRNAEHSVPDLAASAPTPGTAGRAPDAFRPDPTAAVPESEREGLRPATGSSPSLVQDRGSMNSMTAPLDR